MPQHFDLIDEPWILSRGRDGQVRELSLVDIYECAHTLDGIVGEVPTMSFAVLRLLLAVLHRAFEGPEDADAWQELWERDRLPLDVVRAYLDRHRDRFDLLHPDTPFFQVAGLRKAHDDASGLERLIADVPNGVKYFTTRTGSGLATISFAEAARWLVHCQAFDPSGIKSGAVGDPRVRGGRGYPIGVAWTGNIGGLYLERKDLRETLLLNLVPHSYLRLDPDSDLPAWERPPSTECEDVGRMPQGPVDHYTWQSRRVRLVHDGERVHRVLIANGDPCASHDRFRTEPMTAWRLDESQPKKPTNEPPVYTPRRHQPDRALWRGLEALLADAVPRTYERTAQRWLPPQNLGWVAALADGEHLSGDTVVRAHAVGMMYGDSRQSVISDIVDDAMTMSVTLLMASNRELGRTAIEAAGEAETGARALGNLAGDLAAAAGGDADGPRGRARELAYAELDGEFRRWLANIRPESDPFEIRRDWHVKAHRIVLRLGSGLAERAGSAAWIGRKVNKRHISSPEADLQFRRQLQVTYPLAYEDPDETSDDPITEVTA